MVGSSRRALFLVVFILVTCGFLGMLFGQTINPAAAPGGDSDVRDSLRQFTTVYDVVEQNYAEPVNPDKAIYNGAIPGMLHVLDPHSNFFDPKAYCPAARRSARQVLRRGHDGGAAQQQSDRDRAVCGNARPIAPAFVPGDIIAAVDGKPTDNMSTARRGRPVERPQGHHRSHHRCCAKAPTSRSISPWCATRFRATAWTCTS